MAILVIAHARMLQSVLMQNNVVQSLPDPLFQQLVFQVLLHTVLYSILTSKLISISSGSLFTIIINIVQV